MCTDEIHDPEADSWCRGVAAMDSFGRFCQSRYTPRAGSVGMVLVLACVPSARQLHGRVAFGCRASASAAVV